MNWSIPWTRDATYAIEPLARSGHVDEARAAVSAFMSAEPVAQKDAYFAVFDQPRSYFAPYRISVTRYFGNGEEESDWGMGPNEANGSEYNVQLDGWGAFLWATRHYVSADLGGKAGEWLSAAGYNGQSNYDLLIDEVGRPLELAMEERGDGSAVIMKDGSIWEDHNSNRAHFAYTTLTAARGFCDLAAIVSAYKGKEDANYQRFLAAHDKLRAGLVHFQGADGSLRTTIESIDSPQYSYDGAVVEAYSFGLIQPGDVAFDATFGAFEQLKTNSGGYSRRSGYSNRDYENNEWVLLDFRIAGAYLKAGQLDKAEVIVQRLVGWASENYNLLPELIDRNTSLFTGSRPMVGYGAGAFIHYVLERGLVANPSLNTDGTPRCEEGPIGSASPGLGGAGGAPSTTGGAVNGSGGGTVSGGSSGASVSSDGQAANGAQPARAAGCACHLAARKAPLPLLLFSPLLALLIHRRRRRAQQA
jgi:GH15 family glucan-1,4-alpha-glucosidase